MGLNDNLENAAKTVEEKIDASREALGDKAGKVRSKMGDVADEVKQRAQALRDKLRETSWEDVTENASNFVRDNPGKRSASRSRPASCWASSSGGERTDGVARDPATGAARRLPGRARRRCGGSLRVPPGRLRLEGERPRHGAEVPIPCLLGAAALGFILGRTKGRVIAGAAAGLVANVVVKQISRAVESKEF